MNPPLLFIQGVAPANGPFAQLPRLKDNARFVRVYDLDAPLLQDVRAVLIPAHTDQRALRAKRELLQAHLDQGGTLLLNGHIAYPFLNELTHFVPLIERRMDDLRIRRLAPHPIFDGVDEADLSFRRGVAGFYGRGHNPPPPGARPLNGIGTQAAPIDWLYENAQGGRLLMHSGNDLWMHAADRTSARRIAPQLLEWLLAGEPA